MKTSLRLIIMFFFISGHLFSQWYWQNPRPQGNSLLSMCFINNHEGWAAGTNGTILHSGDAGNSWEIQTSNTLATLNAVFFIDPMNGWIAGSFPNSWELILKTADGGLTWEKVLNVATNTPLRDIRFTDADHGWAVGSSGEVKYSVDGGNTWWNRLIPNIQNQNLGAVYFRDNSTGWIVGTNGTILKTTDGGLLWQPVLSPTTKSLNSICFSSALKGTICGDNGTILNTMDGGANWVVHFSGTTGNLTGVSFSTADTGFISGAVILKSVDGGSTWQIVNSTIGTIHGSFPGSSTAYGAGFNGRLVKSANGGETWFELSTGTNKDAIRDAFFLNETTGWLLEIGDRILFTSNGGETWSGIDTTSFFSDAMVFTDPLNGWVSGWNQIARTSDGGYSWSVQFLDPGHTLFLRDIFFSDAGHGWAAGRDTVVRTVDGGINWIKQPVGDMSPFAVFFIDQQTGWMVGEAGKIMKSTDGGVTWTLKPSGTGAELHCVAFTDQNNGWAAGYRTSAGFYSVVLHTADGGETWDYQELPGGQWLYSISFPDSLNGWISGSYGYIFHTEDGGATWNQQANLTGRYLYNISFVNANTGWATGSYGTILKTTNGGIVGIKPGEIPANNENLPIYPNPVCSAGVIRYTLLKPSGVNLALYNSKGQQVRVVAKTRQPAGDHTLRLDVSELPAGIYYFRLQYNEGFETGKVMVINCP